MRTARAWIATLILVPASLTWGQTPANSDGANAKQLLDSAAAEVTYLNFEGAKPKFQELLDTAPEGSELWQAALFGLATCRHQIMPATAGEIDQARRDFERLVEKTPSSRFTPRAMMNLGRIAELTDYLGDAPDLSAARKWYEKVAAAQAGQPIASEAVLRIAGSYIQTYKKDQLAQGIQILEQFLQKNPNDALASAMWQYLGETYFFPLENYAAAIRCYKQADALGLLEAGREGPVYWRMAVIADRYLKDRDTALEYYKKIITKAPTSGKAYEAQLAMRALGVEPPKIELFEPAGDAANTEAR